MVKKYVAPASIVMRWGHNVSPQWVYGQTYTAPPANTKLVSVTPPASTYIYGFYIFSDEANDFQISWTSGGTVYTFLISTGSRGTTYFSDIIPINEGIPADPNTEISITVLRNGNTGMNYRCGIFVGVVQ